MDTSYDAYRMLITTTIGHQLRNQKNCPIYTRIYCPDKSYSLSNHSRIACPVWPVIRIQIMIPKNIRRQMSLKPGEKFKVVGYDDRIEFIQIKPMKSTRGFLKGKDPTFVREERDRL